MELSEKIIELARDEYLLYEGKVKHVDRKDALSRWGTISVKVAKLEAVMVAAKPFIGQKIVDKLSFKDFEEYHVLRKALKALEE